MKVSAECFAHLHRLDSVVDSWQHPRSPGRGRGRSWCSARSWCWCRAGARCCCCSLYSRCYSHSRPGLALPAFSYPLPTAGIWRLLGSVPPRCNRPPPCSGPPTWCCGVATLLRCAGPTSARCGSWAATAGAADRRETARRPAWQSAAAAAVAAPAGRRLRESCISNSAGSVTD